MERRDPKDLHPPPFVALERLFSASRPLIAMIHLPPLPGSPGWRGSMAAILDRVEEDARSFEAGGLDGLLVENYGDAPFFPGPVPPETVAALSLAVDRARKAVSLPVGVNVLRNDARSALAVAAVTGAAFIRVNVHTGTMFTDQGMLEGKAHETLRTRRALGPEVAVCADVLVKHASPPPGVTSEEVARDLRERGRADVLIVSGSGTGRSPDPDRIRRVKASVPDAPIWIGSGLDSNSAPDLLPLADGAIVGSALQRDGQAGAGADPVRIRRFMEEVAPLR